MSAEALTQIVAVFLSLAFSYIPGLSDWYGKLTSEVKRLIMLVLLVLTAAAIFGISCAKWIETGVTCDKAGALGLLQAVLWAIITNQAVYEITPWSKSRRRKTLR